MASVGPNPQHSYGSAQYYSFSPMGGWPSQDPFGCRQSYTFNSANQHGLVSPMFSGQLPNYHQQHFSHFQIPLQSVARRPVNPNFARPFRNPGPIVSQSLPSASVPDAPRGPPRKPKQSGHAVWIGNLPIGTDIHQFKDYCARGATNEIESIFLISKSNCAFANYNSHSACESAIAQIQNSSFNERRLVCRLRMPSGSSSISSIRSGSTDSSCFAASNISSTTPPRTPISINEEMPLIVESPSPKNTNMFPAVQSDSEDKALKIPDEMAKIPERFFIIKSLTVQDLVASVNNGTWESQAHNEETLQAAFRNSNNVYLIFSANKSGEYFGLARMSSDMHTKGEDGTPSITQASDKDLQDGAPRSIVTPATDSAPSGKIHDDSVRGTIFWEADQTVSNDLELGNDNTAPRKQFKVEWLSTSRLPFFRLRGLRNPWNGLKEVKIARDGTELEPNVGRIVARAFRSS